MGAVPGIIGLFNKHVLKMSKKRVGSLLEFPFGGEDEDGLEGQEESLGGRARLWEARGDMERARVLVLLLS